MTFLLVVAGIGAGLAGSIAGLASVVSYPALLAAGLGPLAANVTNTVALTLSATGSVLGSRPELVGQGPRVRRLTAAAIAGGATGAAILLVTPSGDFEKVVPCLIGIASISTLIQPQRRRVLAEVGEHGDSRYLALSIFLVCIYGGYFGAGSGILLLALLIARTGESLARSNAVKNVLAGLANTTAAIGFMLFGPVHWLVLLPLAGGFLLGARVGPIVVRHAPAGPLRVLIAL
jgi:uncharacterized membrane protein YfcA